MTAATMTNAATVSAIYEAFGKGDVPYILEQLADDAMWDADWADHSAQRAGAGHLQPRHGLAGVADFFKLLATWTVEEFQVLDVIGSGRQVVAEIRAAFVLPNGARLADEELHLWTFDASGKVARFRHYVDTAKHLAAAGGTSAVA